MTEFLIYLLESGLCMTFFYAGYVVFFRKEKYFSFNRIYLLLILFLSLVIPLLTISLKVNPDFKFSKSVLKVNSVHKNYESFLFNSEPNDITNVVVKENKINVQQRDLEHKFNTDSIHYLIVIVYLSGVFFCLCRLFLLLLNIYKIKLNGRIVEKNGYTEVWVNKQIPSFSFINWVFISEKLYEFNDVEKIIAHESIHVKNKHSVDLLVASVLCLIHWYNPLVWRLQKSLKTCHEYLVDRQMLSNGYELIDYQSLILSQLISNSSVELVNNFNLLSIKKRIDMMNNIKSSRIAKLKILFVVPLVLTLFVLFANFKDITDQKNHAEIDLPITKVGESLDRYPSLCKITICEDGSLFNGESFELSMLDQKLESLLSKLDSTELKQGAVLLEIDKSISMDKVDVIKEILRNHGLLKVAYATKSSLQEYQGKETAIFVMLLPKKAKLIKEKDYKNVFVFNEYSESLEKEIETYIRSHEHYKICNKYKEDDSFNNFLLSIDAERSVVYKLRKEEAVSRGKTFDSMSEDEQHEIKNKYPMTFYDKNIFYARCGSK